MLGGKFLGGLDNCQQEISIILCGFKGLVCELEVFIVVFSQFSCVVEQWFNYWFMFLDLCELGVIEQDVDIVMFIYCDEYYNKEIDQ